MNKPQVIAFAGSARKDSFNKRLVQIAAERVREHGLDVKFLDLRDFPLPIYDGDLEQEQGIPEPANQLFELFKSSQGFLISCPEYNSSITPLLKNTIDWVSRPRPDEPMLAGFQGKTAALMAASPGGLGGIRGLVHVTAILQNIGTLVVPGSVSLAAAHEMISDAGEIKDNRADGMLNQLCARFSDTLLAAHASKSSVDSVV